LDKFNDISDRCSAYFEGVSADVEAAEQGYITTIIELVQSAKKTLLLRDKDGYSNLKISLFEVLDAAKDVQLHVSSAQYRIGNNAKKINRYIGKKQNWYYEHKYAVKAVKACDEDREIVEGDLKTLSAAFKNFAGKMLPTLGNNVKDSFET
jgi:hypothetical protein